jgi:hypothetical protein
MPSDSPRDAAVGAPRRPALRAQPPLTQTRLALVAAVFLVLAAAAGVVTLLGVSDIARACAGAEGCAAAARATASAAAAFAVSLGAALFATHLARRSRRKGAAPSR